MDWQAPSDDHPAWCAAVDDKQGVPTAQSVSCTRSDPSGASAEMASLHLGQAGAKGLSGDVAAAPMPATAPNFQKFTSQQDLGLFLVEHYKIRTPKDLTSCEVCHR
jgi:hypothetical protein